MINSKIRHSNVKATIGGIASILLIYAGFKYVLTAEQIKLFIEEPFLTLLISMMIIIPGYILGGIQLRLLYSNMSNIKLSIYDIITLPFVTNLWGFIIPFQGSFLYTVIYMLSKYKKSISDSVRIYLLSLSINLFFAGLISILFSIFSDLPFTIWFMSGAIVLLLNPFILHCFGKFLDNFNLKKSSKLFFIKHEIRNLFKLDELNKSTYFYLSAINIANVIINSLWSFWVAISLDLNLSLSQVTLISLLMQITALVKVTPGNIGLNQFASGGIAVLVGGSMSDGFMLSSFQYLTVISLTFTLGSLFSFVNMKHFRWKDLKAMMINKGKE